LRGQRSSAPQPFHRQDIDAILRGANPGDIPFYQAATFIRSINLKSAGTLGITFPPDLLASADEVIE
jgi:putative tryptophan/tyrosine transport system substrate-binding protein